MGVLYVSFIPILSKLKFVACDSLFKVVTGPNTLYKHMRMGHNCQVSTGLNEDRIRENSFIFLTWSLYLTLLMLKCSQEAKEAKESEW